MSAGTRWIKEEMLVAVAAISALLLLTVVGKMLFLF